MDEIQAFREELLARVRVRASADANFHHSAFAELCGELLEEAEELFDFEPCYFRGRGSRNRNLAVDGYSFDEADQSFRIVVAELSGEQVAPRLTRTDAKQLFAASIAFVEDALRGTVEHAADESSPESGLARDLRAKASSVARYRFYLVTDHVLSEKVRDWPEGDVGSTPAEFHIWDVTRFQRANQSRSGRDELVVDFGQIVEGGLPCLPATVDAATYEAYLCVIPGIALADIYEAYGSRLLEGNVRAFLNTTVKVNKGIQQTLQNSPDMFFAYNNGIAATASSVTLDRTPDGMRIRFATDFQIVNGGQTTASLAYARRKSTSSLAGVFVQMKLSVVDEESAGTFIPLISRFSNSQNKVSDADFFSNHEFHRQIEKISRRLRAPAKRGSQVETFWFYERARGQYAVELSRLSAAERRRFEVECPRDQIITKTDLAKVENSWRQLPHEVSRGAQKNFVRFAEYASAQWERDQNLFHDEYFRSAVARVILFRTLERTVPKEAWYNGGYRANIVTYAMAKLAHLIDQKGAGAVLNTIQIWRAQELSSALNEQLRTITAAAYAVITEPEAGIQNVTEWCKRELAWTRLKAAEVPLMREFAEELVDAEAIVSGERTAKTNARVDSGVDATIQVLAVGAGNWDKLRQLSIKAKAVTPAEESLLRVASNPKWIPTDRQSKDLVRLLSRLREEGLTR